MWWTGIGGMCRSPQPPDLHAALCGGSCPGCSFLQPGHAGGDHGSACLPVGGLGFRSLSSTVGLPYRDLAWGLSASGGRRHDGGVHKAWLFVTATLLAAVLLIWSLEALGPESGWFAFLVVWLPMTWLGTVSRMVTPRLPDSYHVLRDFERDGRVYEALGVRVCKSALRRGPLARFNPDLHLPAELNAENLVRLDQRMRDAEASHAILLVALAGVAAHAAMRGWWVAAGSTAMFDLLINGYPVMLQRYNRALLHERYGLSSSSGGDDER